MNDGPDHAWILDTLARMPADTIKHEAESVLPLLGDIEVIHSRTGLVMCPMRDTVQGTDFHLGEALVAEAHIRLADSGTEGYGMVLGRDLEQAMAMALIDAALAAGVDSARLSDVLHAAAEDQRAEDEAVLRRIEATRVDMETF